MVDAGLHNLADASYFDLRYPSSSETKLLIDGTPAHLASSWESPREESEAFAIGAYVHAALLVPDTVDEGFLVTGKIDRRTTAGKSEWESIQKRAALTGARIISQADRDLAMRMVDSVRASGAAARLLNALTHREVTVIGEIGGRPAKAKADGLVAGPDSTVIVDLKTTVSAAPSAFARSAASFNYYHQAAWYARLVSQAVSPVEDVIIIAVEKGAPYLTAVYRVPLEAMLLADARIDGLADAWWRTLEGDRTGYIDSIQTLEPPRWWTQANSSEEL